VATLIIVVRDKKNSLLRCISWELFAAGLFQQWGMVKAMFGFN
jgi:hypothetical protein